jgi:hypothetical protein
MPVIALLSFMVRGTFVHREKKGKPPHGGFSFSGSLGFPVVIGILLALSIGAFLYTFATIVFQSSAQTEKAWT